ncbi:hypothetical protein B0H19DRAFT_1254287 [Mycena capillaripes]|nr:hypothetical protein B0H19DRAFT_1254287 [Mycena capillaripes]
MSFWRPVPPRSIAFPQTQQPLGGTLRDDLDLVIVLTQETRDPESTACGNPHTFTPTTIQESMAKGLIDFAPEVLTRIFLHLSYRSLLSALAVCVQWNAIVTKDPALSVQLFKKSSKVYVEPGCKAESRERGIFDMFETIFGSYDRDPEYLHFKRSMLHYSESILAAAWYKSVKNADQATALLTDPKWFPPERIRLHPALPELSYMIGNGLEDVCFFVKEDQVELSQLKLANDFISIPAVPSASINVAAFHVTVKNSKGITLLDLFSAIAKESTTKIKRGKKTIMKGDLLGDHRFYEGFEMLRRSGHSLSAEVARGS